MLEWLSSKRQKVSVEDGKRQSLCVVGGNVNWCIKYGKQYGDSSKNEKLRDFPGGHWLRLCLTFQGVGLILGWGAKIPHALRPKNQNIKQKQCYNKFNQDV